jgi:putative ABC transport system substrate-binding protein
VELLKEIAPRLARVALLFNPPTATFVEGYLDPFLDAGTKSLLRKRSRDRLAAVAAGAHIKLIGPLRIDRAFAGMAESPDGGFIVMPNVFTAANRERIVAQAARFRIPTVYPLPLFVTAGGLMSYGIDYRDQFRLAASYADRILKGGKPADLPVQQPTKFELVINRKTAKVLGLSIPQTLLASADEVIE